MSSGAELARSDGSGSSQIPRLRVALTRKPREHDNIWAFSTNNTSGSHGPGPVK